VNDNLYIIETTFMPATNTKGSRVRAILHGSREGCYRIIADYRHDCDGHIAYQRVAWILISRRTDAGADWQLIGSSDCKHGYMFVFRKGDA
jgi:hypothetical protein